MHRFCFSVAVLACMERVLQTVINHDHSVHQVFYFLFFIFVMSCLLSYSHSLSNILQSPEAPESINTKRWVFCGVSRYIRMHTHSL